MSYPTYVEEANQREEAKQRAKQPVTIRVSGEDVFDAPQDTTQFYGKSKKFSREEQVRYIVALLLVSTPSRHSLHTRPLSC